ncbi:cytochrome P-450, putative [Pediculus humanus corporis]|uniref:Cytochrome P-450, putative n=1 Tax=Pediculus humanus subsp. corporis TaxID=121224 RepID=E0VCW9_PEDHC|nr:cytochrome P-450, putative [Pediculus humanus corporis]EEB11225.1 cytochrome P-450, putative [Pediculus humanus corporis]
MGFIMYVGLFTLIALFGFYKKNFNYWKNKNVKMTNPWFPLGDISRAGFYKNIGIVMKEIYDKFPGEKFNGCWVFYRPHLMIRDPELIKTIFVKDFNYFRDRGLYFNEKTDPLSANLFFMGGNKWRSLRTKLTSNFSSGKMKKMFENMHEKSLELQKSVKDFAEKDKIIEPKYFTVRYTHDVAATCLLGFQAKCLTNNDSILPYVGHKVFEDTWTNIIKIAVSVFVPDIGTLFRIKITPKDVTNFFFNTVKDVMEFRESQNKDGGFNDFMQTLVKLKKEGYTEYEDVKDYALAQAFIFWMGAFESSASTMQFALYEMSLNNLIQEKARQEVKSVLKKFNGQLTYESLPYMEYLGRVVDETLRKYPPVSVLTRVCLKKYKIPESDVVIEKGTPLIITVLGLHMDPNYYPNPEKFDPERFTEEEKRKRHHYAYIPFGGGLHQCMGQRYGLMQIKIGLANLLVNYKFDISFKTPQRAKICRKNVLYTVRNGIPLDFNKVNLKYHRTGERSHSSVKIDYNLAR